MVTKKLVMASLAALIALVGITAIASAEGNNDNGLDMRKAAGDHLASRIELAPAEKIEIIAETYEEAKALINIAVGSYLQRTEQHFGGPEKAALVGGAVIDGWGDAKLRWERRTFMAGKAIVIDDDTEAKMLGSMMASVAMMLNRVSDNGRLPISNRRTATAIFESIRPDGADPGALVQQYLMELQELSKLPSVDLRQFAVME